MRASGGGLRGQACPGWVGSLPRLSQAADGVSGWGGDFLGFVVNQVLGRASLSVSQSHTISVHGEGGMVAFWLRWGPQGGAQLMNGSGHQESRCGLPFFLRLYPPEG